MEPGEQSEAAMSKAQAVAVWKSIIRNHPFFQGGGMFRYDFRTMVARGYGDDARILKAAIITAEGGAR